MPRDNPSHILRTLDATLTHSVELTLIGKAAIWLGYDSPPEDYGSTLDVDAVVPSSDSLALDQDAAFWEALRQANEALQPLDLYLTHIFEEGQIFLRPDWAVHRVRITRLELQKITLFRPSTLDLILTKMMRGADPTHMEEIQWMIKHDHVTHREMLDCLAAAKLPEDSPEWPDLFQQAQNIICQMSYES
ncbi:hypothetical protein [Brevifollis gellanilyticus]|uniref:Nucleotidyltransferase n=1 Tax=Brevifollis gellanilyticus TaxID=748831 RepID=A0A512M7B4_9BACT|nr:hypothetical protein [Brevifollis gellanilyticus]GEP42625.1 hypothetical protein BGE01nite_19160 [Brevifollis gellanilyticus]